MSETHLAQTERQLRTGTIYGTFGGLLLFPVFLGDFGSGLFDSDPGHTLRVIESVGILLPLFAGLLRFTTNDQSSVSNRVNDYLLLGILGLVVAGVFATLAGVVMDVVGVLKVSLFFVLLTFLTIGFAVVVMFRDVPNSMVRPTSTPEQNGVNDADVPTQELEAKTGDSSCRGSGDSDSSDVQIQTVTESPTEIEPTERGPGLPDPESKDSRRDRE